MIRDNLWQHNLNALSRVEETFTHADSAVVVQPTGSGKSGIMFGLIESMSKAKKVLIVEPYTSIEQAHKSSELWSSDWSDKVRYITYSYLGNIRDSDEEELKELDLCDLDLVILDEVHHVGAPLWLLGFKRLKEVNPNGKFLGMTATPVRYLDGAVNVADEYFEGNLIECLTLIQAIKEGIFTRPIYVNSVYDVDNIFNDVEHRINSALIPDASRSSLHSLLDKAKIDWSNQEGVEAVLEKYINEYLSDEPNPKFLVFMSSIAELKRFRASVIKWFKSKKLRARVYAHELHSAEESDDAKVLSRFTNVKKDAIDLLFSVNKINEGVHLKGVSGVVMLRSTMSPIVCYQQIGRALSAGMTNRPLIFDFVNNYSSLKTIRQLLIDEDDTTSTDSLFKGDASYQTVDYSTVTIHDEMQLIENIYTQIDAKLDIEPTMWESDADADWDYCLSLVCEFMTIHRRIPSVKEHFDMGVWFRNQVALMKLDHLSPDRVKILTDRGIAI